MKNDTEGRNLSFSLLLTNASDLMGKKSVRATFKLSAEFIEVLSIKNVYSNIEEVVSKGKRITTFPMEKL
jgi:hypothetical protein